MHSTGSPRDAEPFPGAVLMRQERPCYSGGHSCPTACHTTNLTNTPACAYAHTRGYEPTSIARVKPSEKKPYAGCRNPQISPHFFAYCCVLIIHTSSIATKLSARQICSLLCTRSSWAICIIWGQSKGLFCIKGRNLELALCRTE